MKRILIGLSIAIPLGIAIVLIFLRVFFLSYYRIPQNGMFPTLPAGSILIAQRNPYKSIDQISRGEIIIFDQGYNGTEYTFIWRVIGLPGDKIECTWKRVILNGTILPREPAGNRSGHVLFNETLNDHTYPIAFSNSPEKWPPDIYLTVPIGHVFVLGDNRFNALDSRTIGPVPFESIKARKLYAPNRPRD